MVTVRQIKKHKRMVESVHKEVRQTWISRCVLAFMAGMMFGAAIVAVIK